jgi:uncharacterized protein (TIGR00255 family)
MSLHSMTGAGAATLVVAPHTIHVDVRTLNHKGLDAKVKLPPQAPVALETELMAAIKQVLSRGRVELAVRVDHDNAAASIDIDESAVRAALAKVEQLCTHVPNLANLKPMTMADVLRLPGVMQQAQRVSAWDEHTTDAVQRATTMALAALQTMRAREGTALHAVIAQHCSAIEAFTNDIAARTTDAPERHMARLQARVAALGVQVDETRLAQEVALLAERMDVTEELNRLRMHVAHARQLLNESCPGRKLDFLCQEFLREANTTGSKCQDAPVAHVVVQLKAEIERMREQIQNIE